MNGQEFIEKINGMKNGDYYTHEGRNEVFYQFHKYGGMYEVWTVVNGFHVSNIHFDRMKITGCIVSLTLGNEYAGCPPKFQMGVE